MDIVTDKRRLRKRSKEVEESEDATKAIGQLFNELPQHNALGLSAIQLGYPLRTFVMKRAIGSPVCLLNPEITKQKGTQIATEACLSIPGVTVKIKRPQHIKVKAMNQYFKFVKYQFSGLEARIVCHEMDHLDGKLIIDFQEAD